MRRVVWSEYISLDGVVEEPGEWSIPYFSDDLAQYKSEELYESDALLLGRSTYEGFAAAWPEMEEIEGGSAVTSQPAELMTFEVRRVPNRRYTLGLPSDRFRVARRSHGCDSRRRPAPRRARR
jgi:dihydrofolate reductase